jgi:sterol desaturase/sphingolipid hydroxylase (fatty acid hydroxylase superfamily)
MKPRQQKELSVLTVVAIAQTLGWLILLPDVCRPIWPVVFLKISSPLLREILLNQIPTICFCVYGLIIIPIYYLQLPFFEQFKIDRDKPWPWLDAREEVRNDFWKLTKRSFGLCSFNLLVLVPLATTLKYYVMEVFLQMDQLSYDDQNWPTNIDLIKQNILLTILHEFLFHSTHRAMHIYPSLYKYHKVHHEYKQNVFHASQHNHPIDYLFSIAAPVVLALTIVRPVHSFTQFHFAIYAVYTNLDDHVGYSFPFSPVRWFPLAALTQEHEFHHSVNIGCFSSKLDLFERLFGTNTKFLEWEEKRMDSLVKPKTN